MGAQKNGSGSEIDKRGICHSWARMSGSHWWVLLFFSLRALFESCSVHALKILSTVFDSYCIWFICCLLGSFASFLIVGLFSFCPFVFPSTSFHCAVKLISQSYNAFVLSSDKRVLGASELVPSLEGQGRVKKGGGVEADWGKGIWRGQREWHLAQATQWLWKLFFFSVWHCETCVCLQTWKPLRVSAGSKEIYCGGFLFSWWNWSAALCFSWALNF